MAGEWIYKKDFEVRFYDCSPNSCARVSTIMKNLGDVAGLDYTERGYGHDKLWDEGMVFLLSRVSIHFERMPKIDEKITFATWEHGIEGPMFYRYFEILDENGVVIADANTAWLLVDPVSRKILRPNTFYGEFKIVADKTISAKEPKRIKLPDSAKYVGERKTYYSDLDENGHMNNSRYADISVDFLDKELQKREVKDFVINFNKEVFLDDILKVKVAKTDDENCFIVGAECEKDGKTVNSFTTEITFK